MSDKKYRNMPIHPMLVEFSIDTQEGNFSGIIGPKMGRVLIYDGSSCVRDKRFAAIILSYNRRVLELEDEIESIRYR